MPFGDFNPATHPPGELFDQFVGAGRLIPTAASIWSIRSRSWPTPQSVQSSLMMQVFDDGQFLVEARGLKDDPQLAANRPGLRCEIAPEMRIFARLQRNQRREHAKERRLAAAIGTEEDENLPRFDRQR